MGGANNMTANKIFFDLYWSKTNYYEKNDQVYIALLDCGIFTKVARKEMFNRDMTHGCFIENYSYHTADDVKKNALKFMKRHNLKMVDNDTFIKLEKEKQAERVARAFNYAEKLIREG